MKIKTLVPFIIILLFTFGLFAQDRKKPESKKKHEKTLWDKNIMRNGKDTRFTKHKRRQYLKPPREQN